MDKPFDKNISISMEIDLQTRNTLASIKDDKSEVSETDLTIASKITQSIKKLFNSDARDWIGEYTELVKNDKNDKAFELLNQKLFFLDSRKISEETFLEIIKLEYKKLSEKDQLNFLTIIIAIGYYSGFYSLIEPFIAICINDFPDLIDNELLGRLYLTQSEIFLNSKKTLSANEVLNLIVNGDYSNEIKAYAYKQLSWITQLKDDKLIYLERAHDLFLCSGNRKEAVYQLISSYNSLLSDNPLEALNKIDEAILLQNSESNIDKELSASLHQKKALILSERKLYNDSLKEIEIALELRSKLIGNEIQKYASFRFAQEIAKLLKDTQKESEYYVNANIIKEKIKEKNFTLQLEIEDAISNKSLMSDQLKEKVLKEGDAKQKIAFLILRAFYNQVKFTEKLKLLDLALSIQSDELNDPSESSLIYASIGEIYKNNNDILKALEWYNKSLNSNPFNMNALQSCLAMLWKEKKWIDIENIAYHQIQLVGYFPNLYYVYGKSLLEQSKFIEAYKVLKECKSDIKFEISHEISKCIENIDDISPILSPAVISKNKITINEFESALSEILKSISTKSRMHLWKYDKSKKKHSWVSQPEEHVKHLLIQGLSSKYSENDFEVLEEIKVGAGRIDLYVLIGNSFKVVIELKMCGSGYSSSYALSGKDQLVSYLEGKNLFFGFLIVFDGRMEDFSKGFTKIQSIDSITIYTLPVDMRPKIK